MANTSKSDVSKTIPGMSGANRKLHKNEPPMTNPVKINTTDATVMSFFLFIFIFGIIRAGAMPDAKRATKVPQPEQNVAVGFMTFPHCLQNLLFAGACGETLPPVCATELPQPEQNVAVGFRTFPQCIHFIANTL
jgi:hypothetical protein